MQKRIENLESEMNSIEIKRNYQTGIMLSDSVSTRNYLLSLGPGSIKLSENKALFYKDIVIAPALLSLRGREGVWPGNRFITLTLFGVAFYLFFSSAIFGLGLVGGSLSAADRKTIAWVDENIPPGSDFLLMTGEQYSMKDPFQEWFPALTRQHSQTTLQGDEWTLGADFFPFYGELVALQHCADISCVEAWGDRTGLSHRYLLIKMLPPDSPSPLRDSLGLLRTSARKSNQYKLIYESKDAAIFEH